MNGKKKKGKEEKRKEKNDHKAFISPEKILPNVVKSSGYLEACLVAFDMDEAKDGNGKPIFATAALERFKKQHIVGYVRQSAIWADGQASWMFNAIQAAKRADPRVFLNRVAAGYLANPRHDKSVAYRRMKQVAPVLDELMPGRGSRALSEIEHLPFLKESMEAEEKRVAADILRQARKIAEENRKADAEDRAAAAISQR